MCNIIVLHNVVYLKINVIISSGESSIYFINYSFRSFTLRGLVQVFYDVKDIPHGTWLVYRHAAYMTMSQFRSRGLISRCDMKMFETSEFGASLLLNLELLFFDVISFIFGIQTIFFLSKYLFF